MAKKCPLKKFTRTYDSEPTEAVEDFDDCLEEECAWWIQNDFEVENNRPGRCAIVSLTGGLGALERELEKLVGR